MEFSLLVGIGASLITHLPVFLVWLASALVAIFRPGLPRRVVELLLGGLAAQFVLNVIGTAMAIVLPVKLREGGATASAVGITMSLWTVALNIGAAAAWALVLLAVFARRQPPKDVLADGPRPASIEG